MPCTAEMFFILNVLCGSLGTVQAAITISAIFTEAYQYQTSTETHMQCSVCVYWFLAVAIASTHTTQICALLFLQVTSIQLISLG